MPQAIAAFILPFIVGPATVGALGFTGVATLSLAIGYGVTLGASYLLSKLLAPDQQQTSVPKPEDGRYNLRQSVPSPWIRLGRSQGGGHYTALLEYEGVAYHVIVVAAHRIKGFTKFRLHDEDVTLDGSGFVTSPAHYNSKVQILTRLGEYAETAYAPMVSVFSASDVWTNDHRGDGLASFMMSAATVPAEDYQKTYPLQMPLPTCEIEGHDRIYDPRTDTYGYSENLALLRLWHLTSPYGLKLKLADIYLPDFINAANVCDESVTNRAGGTEYRYHGGARFPANADPVAVGVMLDQAAEMVIYERADGLVGVHAGEMTTPTVTIEARDIKSIVFQSNRKKSTNVLAVRGQWTDPSAEYTTADAAIYGDPYVDDGTDYTKTVENPAVQTHNHIQRLQKLRYIRSRAQRVSIVADFTAAEDVPFSRFVTVNHPPKLVGARCEIIGRPKKSLKDMTVSFDAIVVPTTLFDFVAAAEEGLPGSSVTPAPATTLSAPTGFGVTIESESVSGSTVAAFGEATWDAGSSSLVYELEWEPSAGGTKQSVLSAAGATTLRTGYLADGVEYDFRVYTWGGVSRSDPTSDVTLTAVADPVAPGVVTSVSATGGAGEVTLGWTTPNSANYAATRIYRHTSNDFGAASEVTPREYGPANSVDSRVDTGLSAGTYYYWLVAVNGSSTPATEVATGSVSVT
jgi:hypothetical protein